MILYLHILLFIRLDLAQLLTIFSLSSNILPPSYLLLPTYSFLPTPSSFPPFLLPTYYFTTLLLYSFTTLLPLSITSKHILAL